MNYSVRGTNSFGAMPNNNNYGQIVEGNRRNSYGPWVDPELQRHPHGRRSVLAMHHKRKRGGY